MTTFIKTYSTELAARRAVQALRATGVPERDIRLLAGTALRDIHHQPVGGFAGPIAPDAPVGTYGGRALQRRQGASSFAGDPDQQRQGSFADTDRVVIITYNGDAERTRITGLRGARRLLRRAALDDDAVDRTVLELHQGHAILLVDLRELAAPDANAQLEKPARAALSVYGAQHADLDARADVSGAAAPTPTPGRAARRGLAHPSPRASRTPRRDRPRCSYGRQRLHASDLI